MHMRLDAPDANRPKPLLLIALMLTALVLISVFYREGEQGFLHGARRAVLAVSAPLYSAGTSVARPFERLGDWIAGLRVSRSEIEAVRRQNDQLRARLAELEEARQENERLRAIVDFVRERNLTQLGARVIGRPANSWEGVIIIDRGSVDGIQVGMPVIAPQGLVGQIAEVSKHASRVRLITDEQSGVAAMVQRTRAIGIVRGSIDRVLTLDYVDTSKLPEVGDVVITSGLGGVYPKGLVVGDVIAVDARRADLYPRIIVQSRVPVSELEEVIVLVGSAVTQPAGGVE